MVDVALEDKFVDTQSSLSRLAESVESGELALPEMQRPFVWNNTDVRDLFDSLFRGYPVGNIMTWRTRSEDVKFIGTNEKSLEASLLLIDGQQRVTSIYAILHGAQVLGSDYRPRQLKVAFKPTEGRFETLNSAIEKNPEWLNNITDAFSRNAYDVVNSYIRGMEEAGRPLSPVQRDTAIANISRLVDLPKFKLAVVELKSHAEVQDVAEVFVRTNNGGKKLGQSDFVLTLMSVHAQQDRMDLETWVRAAHTKTSFNGGKTPWNPHIVPDATQLVRVVASLAFRRAALSDVYAFLRGNPLTDEGEAVEQRTARFATWSEAQKEVISTHNWHEFLRVLDTAGYRSQRQISSDFAVLATYALWLHGKRRGVDRRHLENLLARWFYAASVTGRYSGSSESTLAGDLHALTSDDVDMVQAVERRLASIMTDDYFTTTLPEELDSRSWRNKAMFAYEAAQVVLDSPVLFSPSNEKVSHRLAPTTTTVKGIERHHLFPKAYLQRETGLSGHAWSALANRPANSSLVDWIENGDISDDAPAVYWPIVAERLDPASLQEQMHHHALYEGWWQSDYDEFCHRRRELMAEMIRRGYQTLLDRCPVHVDAAPETDTPQVSGGTTRQEPEVFEPVASDVTVLDLLDAELLLASETVQHQSAGAEGRGVINEDGTLTVGDVRYADPDGAAAALNGGTPINGWETWSVQRQEGWVNLASLREEYLVRERRAA
jgi:hypothetical protein